METSWLALVLAVMSLAAADIYQSDMPKRNMPRRLVRGSPNGACGCGSDGPSRYPLDTTSRGHLARCRHLVTFGLLILLASFAGYTVRRHRDDPRFCQ